MGAYLFAGEATLAVLDSLFYISPTVVVGMLILSRAMKLCKWHRFACSLPLFPQLSVILDDTVLTFSSYAVIAHIVTMAAMAVVAIVAGYQIFFNGR